MALEVRPGCPSGVGREEAARRTECETQAGRVARPLESWLTCALAIRRPRTFGRVAGCLLVFPDCLGFGPDALRFLGGPGYPFQDAMAQNRNDVAILLWHMLTLQLQCEAVGRHADLQGIQPEAGGSR